MNEVETYTLYANNFGDTSTSTIYIIPGSQLDKLGASGKRLFIKSSTLVAAAYGQVLHTENDKQNIDKLQNVMAKVSRSDYPNNSATDNLILLNESEQHNSFFDTDASKELSKKQKKKQKKKLLKSQNQQKTANRCDFGPDYLINNNNNINDVNNYNNNLSEDESSFPINNNKLCDRNYENPINIIDDNRQLQNLEKNIIKVNDMKAEEIGIVSENKNFENCTLNDDIKKSIIENNNSKKNNKKTCECEGIFIEDIVGLSSELYNILGLKINNKKNTESYDIIQISFIYEEFNYIPDIVYFEIFDVVSNNIKTEIKGLELSDYWKVYDALQLKSNYMIVEKIIENKLIALHSQVDLKIISWKITFRVSQISFKQNLIPELSKYCKICKKTQRLILKIPENIKVKFRPPIQPLSLETSVLTSNKNEAIGWDKVGGANSIIEQLNKSFIIPLMFPQLFDLYGISPPRGFILYGPPGTGKTHLARCLAEEIQSRWIILWNQLKTNMPSSMILSNQPPPKPAIETLSGGDLISGSRGEEIINNLFDRCRKRFETLQIGTLILIDELDTICPNREKTGNAEKRMVSAMLTNLDGLKSSGREIVLLATTNRPNAVDSAIRRAGRFDKEIEIGVPNSTEREIILTKMLNSMNHQLTKDEIKKLASCCQAFVAADLKLLCSSAGQSAMSEIINFNDNKFNQSGIQPVRLNHFYDALKGIKPSGMKEVSVEVPEVKWSDIGGYETVKQSLKESVEWPIKYQDVFHRLNVSPPRGILLYGPPGCSKTLMAKAVATESKMNFISVKGPELFSKWVGESEKAVREVFRKARQNSPCVVFFDEIDAIGCDRQSISSSSGVESRVLSQMLNEMDGVGILRQVIVIGATNRPDLLDAALLRPGRLDRHIYVSLPDSHSRKDILSVHLKCPKKDDNININIEDNTSVCNALIEKLTVLTDGYSGAEIAMICREAAMISLREQIDNNVPQEKIISSISWKHLRLCLNIIKPRISKELIIQYEIYQNKTARV